MQNERLIRTRISFVQSDLVLISLSNRSTDRRWKILPELLSTIVLPAGQLEHMLLFCGVLDVSGHSRWAMRP